MRNTGTTVQVAADTLGMMMRFNLLKILVTRKMQLMIAMLMQECKMSRVEMLNLQIKKLSRLKQVPRTQYLLIRETYPKTTWTTTRVWKRHRWSQVCITKSSTDEHLKMID